MLYEPTRGCPRLSKSAVSAEFLEAGEYDDLLLVSRAVPLLKWFDSYANEAFSSIRFVIKFEGDTTTVNALMLADMYVEKIKNNTIVNAAFEVYRQAEAYCEEH